MCDSSFFPLGFDAPVCWLMLVEFFIFLFFLFVWSHLMVTDLFGV